MSKRLNRIPIMLTDAELDAIDNWRFSNRVGTRSDTIRRLCQIAFSASIDAPPMDEKKDGAA